jgi:hypothetical protein
MKHYLRRVVWILGLFLFFALITYRSTSQASLGLKAKCPDKFVGTVTKVIDSKAPFTSFEKLDVLFKVQEKILGDVGDVETIKILKHGPHLFSLGDKYEVALRNHFICSVRKID